MPYHLRKPILLVAYDSRWPARFEEERLLLAEALGPALVALEHCGSTAVPGLYAKPILDLLAGLRRLADLEGKKPLLENLGYLDARIRVPGRRLFCKGGPYNEGTHHLHFVEHGSDAWAEPLLFRDALRADPEQAAAYSRLKRELAVRHGTDLDGYTDGKGVFIQAVLESARRFPLR